MSRILKIMSIAVILFLAYIWYGILSKSWNEKTESSSSVDFFQEEEVDSLPLDDDFFNESTSQDNIDYDEVDKIVEEKSKIESTKSTNVKPREPIVKPVEEKSNRVVEVSKPVIEKKSIPNNTVSSVGEYFVLAGSYSVEENADQMVQKLKDLGFSMSEKVVFDESDYYSVSAGRIKDHDDALKLVASLKVKGIDAYARLNK